MASATLRVFGAGGGAVARAAVAARVTVLLAVRVLLYPLSDRLGYLAIGLQVFPEGDLVAVDDHLVLRPMQFTSQLHERYALVAVGVAIFLVWLYLLVYIQVVDVLQVDVGLANALDFTEVDLAISKEHCLLFILVDVVFLFSASKIQQH